ncbi:SAM-dependent methyltransferase [Acinetobacter sp. A3.8]|uniref:SAM-dependent methyltransferase n=1 Tax=Acinetobacter sedimenti TaxID=2919922 RepID=A0A9X1X0W8_9GAMM|nr:SAM-dependent methyltransferase [Acinetobacter sedimenti]MCJ8147020.1 SAM-dependent methyltransferase [Acinetobacter sedimenti]
MSAIRLQGQAFEFFQHIQQAWQSNTLQRLIFSQYQGEEANLQKLMIRPITLKDELQLQVVYRYQTKDIAKNYTWQEFESLSSDWLMQFKQSNLFTDQAEFQLKLKKQQWQLTQTQIKTTKHTASNQQENINTAQQHNRQKQRWIEQDRQFLQLLGVTDQKHQIIPSMSRKWKQINKFVEIFAGAVNQAGFTENQNLHVVDFGSGKGYLTCAVYDYLQAHQFAPQVTGVELRQELVDFCQNVATQSDFQHLQFFQGDVRSYQPEQTDVMIALHACDIATDFAIHTGIRLDTKVIMCAPCCHKELRPQMQSPSVLSPMLGYGVHMGQQAEMLTDTIRALFLQAYGYETKVLEFVSLEHTSKNKMILATKKRNAENQPNQKVLQQIADLKAFYGIRNHALENLLKDMPVDDRHGCAC